MSEQAQPVVLVRPNRTLMRQDNSTFARKVLLRRQMLKMVPDPVVMDCYGGYGDLFKACYSEIRHGCVFEKDEVKVASLVHQRPNWSVYEGDAIRAIREGAGRHLICNVIDVDAYGEPWSCIDAVFSSPRTWPDELHVVVNDGLRQKCRYGGAWVVKALQSMVARYGNNLFPSYKEICQELLAEKAAQVGYIMTGWAGYYCGDMANITHYHSVFKKG